MRFSRTCALFLTTAISSIFITVATPPMARTWYVTADGNGAAPTIQAALDSSAVHDTVMVAAGTYNEVIAFDSVHVLSEFGAAMTILDGGGDGPVVRMSGDGVLRGFTVRNGVAVFDYVPGDVSSGGGIHCTGNGRISRCVVTGNWAEQDGGGIFVNGAQPVIDHCTISSNYVEGTGGSGGGIFVGGGAIITHCTISSNSVWQRNSGGGGGIAVLGSPEVIIDNCTITNNSVSVSADIPGASAFSQGGGIYLSTVNIPQSPVISNCEISNNEAHGTGQGGGVYAGGWALPVISDSAIRGNTATDGGGLLIVGSTEPWGSCYIENSVISGNQADTGGGIGIRSPVVIANSTVAGNSAVSQGGGIEIDTSAEPVGVFSSILWANCAPQGEQLYLSQGSVTVDCSDVDSTGVAMDSGTLTWESYNIFTNPYFCVSAHCEDAPTIEGDYTLAATSDASNARGCGLIGAFGVGCSTPTAIGGGADLARLRSVLSAYPNPFNPETTIRYRVSTAGLVTLAIYDVRGRLVDILASEPKPAGEHTATWNARDAAGRPVASGVYFARIESDEQVRTIKVLLLK